MVTIREIAKLSNLSVGTVSNILNNVETVNKKAKEKVLKIIKDLNYKPSRMKIDIFNRIKIPIVIVDREIEGLNRDLVIVNNVKGSYEIVKYLINKGHKRIAMLNGPRHIGTSKERFAGWKKALIESRLFEEELVVWGKFSIESGYEMMKFLNKKIENIDAIFAANDLIAIGTIQYLEAQNLKVPEDISVVGFDDIYISRLIKPGLTTVRQNIYKLGKISAELLLKRMTNPDCQESKRVILDGALIIRGSVK